MGIPDRVLSAVQHMQNGAYESALHDICSAIEPTAKAEYGGSGPEVYKRFVTENTLLITRLAFGGGGIEEMNFGFSHPRIRETADGLSGFDAMVYTAIRCGLYHESSMPPNLVFHAGAEIEVKDDLLRLPSSIIHGIIIAVVVSPVNAAQTGGGSAGIVCGGVRVPFELLWGRRRELLWLLDVNLAVHRQSRESSANSD